MMWKKITGASMAEGANSCYSKAVFLPYAEIPLYVEE